MIGHFEAREHRLSNSKVINMPPDHIFNLFNLYEGEGRMPQGDINYQTYQARVQSLDRLIM